MPKKKPAPKKKTPPRMTKGAQALANSLSGGGMTIAPPPMGMPSNGPMQMGIMGPDMMQGYISEPGTPKTKTKKKAKHKAKKK